MTLTAAEIWRNLEIPTVRAAGLHKPVKEEISAWGTLMENLRAGGGLAYYNKAALLADLAHAANVTAVVYNDATPANNGTYQKSGVSGSGTWDRIGDLSTGIVRLTVTGGTANAIVATAPETPTMPGNKLYLLTPTANNTGSATIAVNGGSAVAIKNALGSSLAANSLIDGSPVLMVWSVDHYQLMVSVPVDATGILNDALAAQTAAAAAAAAAAASASALGNQVHQYDTRALAIAATIPTGVQAIKVTRYATGHPLAYATYIPGTSAGPMAFQEAGGHWWELDISSGVLAAAWFGVSGNGSNQTSALQLAVDAVPSTGGTILLGGDILITSLDLRGRSLIRLIGTGGWGAGADQTTTLHTAAGAGVARVIDARESIGITFEYLKIAGTNAAHDGYLIDFGQSTLSSFSQTMSLKDCVVLYAGTAAAVNLYGALAGSYEKCLFGGSGTSIAFQTVARVDQLIFSNVHNFRWCDFNPSGTALPVVGSGEQITFEGCNIQASSTDGQGRFWNTSLVVPFIAVSIFNSAFYDATTGGNTWGNFYAGNGLNIIGNRVGGAGVSPSNYGFALGSALNGVKGFTVLGNDAQFITALLGFNGSAGAGTNATKGVVGGNSVRGSTSLLYSGLGAADAKLTNLGNYIAGGGQGENFFISGLPTGPANAGDWYSNSGVVTVG